MSPSTIEVEYTYLQVTHPVLVFGEDFRFLSLSSGFLTIVAEHDEAEHVEDVEEEGRRLR